jgi:GT2 family glycosyltransferase
MAVFLRGTACFMPALPPRNQIAVVILNWNGKHMLEQFLPGILTHSAGHARIVIADNASTDDSLRYLRSFESQIEIILLSSNFGFTGGYNRALKEIKAEYYILLNSDVEVTPGWIVPVITHMQSDPQVAACQPKVRSYSDRHLLEHAGAAGGYLDFLGYPFCRGRIFTSLEEDKAQYNDIRRVFWATGACMFIRSEAFHSMKGFDEDFFAHMEEIDLCWRLQQSGHAVAVVPQSSIYHVGGGTLPKSSPRKTYYNFRNNLLMLHKNMSLAALCYTIPVRLILDGIAGLKFLLNGDAGDFFAVIRAHFRFYMMLPGRMKIRKQQQQLRQTEKVTGLYKGSIVMDYYVREKKVFSELNISKFSR